MPQAMEINLPKDLADVEVAESKLLTLRIDNDDRFFWNIGDPAKQLPQLLPSITRPGDTTGYKMDSDSLRMLLKNMNYDIPKLNTLILINKKARYASMVDVLDEIDLLERSWNAEIGRRLNKEVKELTKDEKFSYRYAMGEWEDRDDRIIAAAISVAAGGGE
jgi:biopolymer transport protein ExbD